MADIMNGTSFDQCIKCSICNVYCPVHNVTEKYPGPKHSGPDAERFRMKNPALADPSLFYCSNCKRCETACPSGVSITDMIMNARFKNRSASRPAEFILSHTDLLGSMSVPFSRLVNFLLRRTMVKKIIALAGISNKRTFPEYAAKKFSSLVQEGQQGDVTVFHGCYNNYNNHETIQSLDFVFEKLGISPGYTREKCCGVALIANNFRDKAIKNARHNLAEFRKTSNEILFISPSCMLAVTGEYRSLLELDNSDIRARSRFITEYLVAEIRKRKPDMKPLDMKIAYHAPCHLEKTGHVGDSLELLKMIPGVELINMNSGCCGIAGTYGFKTANHDIAQAIGKNLFGLTKSINPDYVATDCETCKMQIDMSTEKEALHPVVFLAMSMGFKPSSS